jgi:transposase
MNTLTRQRRRFTPQQKAEAIALCQSEGLTILEASKRLGIHSTCLGRWIRKIEIDAQGPAKNGSLCTSERDEMTRLTKGIRELRRERHFFKLAAAHLAKEELSLKSINSGIYKAPNFQSTGWPTSYTSRVAVTTPGCIVKIILAHVPWNEDELGEAIEPFQGP